MVATVVMSIMVLMIGSVFQQTSSAWDSGYARAEGGMAVRTVVGAISRDLATAVDGRRFGLGRPVECDESSLTFVRLREGSEGGFERVTYSLGDNTATRNGKELVSIDSKKPFDAKFSLYVPEEYAPEVDPDPGDEKVPVRPFETGSFSHGGGKGPVVWTVPYVKVRCTLSRKGSLSGLFVRSLGHDGVGNEQSGADDIIVH
jgi:hypothetical protein